MNLNSFIILCVLLGCVQMSTQQFWLNKKTANKNNGLPTNFNDKQPLNMKIQHNPWYQPFVTQYEVEKPVVTHAPKPVHTSAVPAYHTTHHATHHTTKPPVVEPTYEIVQPHLPHGAAFPVQKPVMSYTGEIIIENTVGGVSFDCRGLPTGHWRDPNYCDVFHACVHGYHRKTYACPIVGHRTYFDEHAQKCEFVHVNPSGCSAQKYFK